MMQHKEHTHLVRRMQVIKMQTFIAAYGVGDANSKIRYQLDKPLLSYANSTA